MANIALSEAEKTFILHGVEVLFLVYKLLIKFMLKFCVVQIGRLSLRWAIT